MYRCPYCNGSIEQSADGTRERHAAHVLHKCSGCTAYSVQHANGKTYPLSDRRDPDADTVNKIVD